LRLGLVEYGGIEYEVRGAQALRRRSLVMGTVRCFANVPPGEDGGIELRSGRV
jgi:hypothetical protein